MSRRAGLVSLGVGLAAAGAGAALGIAAERLTVGRPLLPSSGAGREDDGEDYGGLRTPGVEVTADDGIVLHAEVEEMDGESPVTVVFCHGYALSMDSWHFQRKALRGRYRLVFWDQRGHGLSGTGAPDSATIDQEGADLAAVIAAVAPEGPLVLVGHSMGGMTVMSLADHHPELFAERVLGVGLVATSAGGLDEHDYGVTGLGRLVQQAGPTALRALNRAPRFVENARKLGSDLEMVLVRRWSYASDVSPTLVRFTARMIAETRLEVIADYLPTFSEHDKRHALAVLDGLEVLVIVGDSDLMTPTEHSQHIVNLIPGAEHVVVRSAGHLVMLEHPDIVTEHLDELVQRSLRATARPGRERAPRLPGVRRTVTSLRRRGGSDDDEGQDRGRRGRRRRGRRGEGVA